jgi:hypothetical protein
MRISLDFIHRQQSQAGFCLIPICSGAKCPPRGFPLADAFSNPLPSLLLSKYLEGEQDVAVILGLPSGNLFVFDIDVKQLPFALPETLTSRTLRGFHYYYRADILPASRTLWLEGTKIGEVLAAKHMCKVPPSRFAGGYYRWENRLPPVRLSPDALDVLLGKFDAPPPPPPPPPQRLEVSHPDRYLLAKIRGEIGNMDGAPKGCRNQALVNCCVKLKGVDPSLWKPHLTAAALRAGLSQAEILAVFKWSDHLA